MPDCQIDWWSNLNDRWHSVMHAIAIARWRFLAESSKIAAKTNDLIKE
jgi:hypothetical protein